MFIINKITKEEADKAIDLFLEDTDKEIENWKNGVYKNSPEMQEWVKKKIITGLLQLPELQKTILIPKLIQVGMFTSSEIDEAFKIPIEKRKFWHLGELQDSNLPPEEMLVGRGLIPKQGFALIGGLTKEGKTLLSLQFCLSLISGNHFLEEFPIEKKHRILYIFHENTFQGLKEITKKQVEGLHGIGIDIKTEDRDNLSLWDGKELILNLGNPNLIEIKKAINEARPDIIFLDPIGQFIGFDINKAENIKKFIDLLRKINNCFWILIHHYVKPSIKREGDQDIDSIYKLLGSSYLANACESFIGLEPEGGRYSTDYKKIYFKLRRESNPIPLHLKRDNKFLIYEPIDYTELTGSQKGYVEDIVKYLEKSFNGKASYKDIASLCSQELGVSEVRIAQLLAEGRKDGILDKEEGKRGKWFVKKLFLPIV